MTETDPRFVRIGEEMTGVDVTEPKIRVTERYSYGYIDPRAVFGTMTEGPSIFPGIPLRTILGVTVAGKFYPKHPPIERDWDHVTELLTVEEEKP